MGATLKPTGVAPESTYTINASSSPYGTQNASQLFDDIQAGYNQVGGFYWSDINQYIDITIDSNVNIWALPNTDFVGSEAGLLKIEKWNGSGWDNITGTTTQATRSVTSASEWVVIFPALPTGRYKFSYAAARHDGEWYLETIPTIKYLIQDGINNSTSPIKYYDGAWQTIAATNYDNLADTNFTTNGMSSLPAKAVLDTLASPDNFKILVWSDEASPSFNMVVTAVPEDQLITGTSDILLTHLDNIDSFTIAGNGANGDVRVVVSNDSGTTWYTNNAGTWEEVTISLSNVLTDGNTITELNAISSANWNTLCLIPAKIRFAFAMSQTTVNTTPELDTLTSQIDQVGSWQQLKDADYDVVYYNTEMDVVIRFSGDVKIIY